MLRLNNITKTYVTGDLTQKALDGISIAFRKSEFVSVLGQSGSGKTTLLNIIGGLDQYTSGDLVINGKSTREYNDADWDTYRNHSIGFVFQSYNLIPHQSVLANVELALTLSGVSKAERRRRAIEALQAVGLGDQIHKRPNQMSGGQMQRVSIARALINNPDILLADEPTGALDSETSIQVMELLKEIAKDRLVIMVTHNPELAETYSTRIVRLLDGRITSDSDPYEDESTAQVLSKKEQRRQKSEKKKKSMSFFTALSLSLNNLMTKKGRTFLTSFAGSIGIIGIALILSVSTGFQAYIDAVQEETLTSYPITIEAESFDMSSMLVSFMGARQEREENMVREDDRVYSATVMFDMINAMMSTEMSTNNLRAFKAYLDAGGGGISDLATIRYGYDVQFDIYTEDEDGNIVKSDVMTLIQSAMSTLYGGDYSSYFSTMGSMYSGMDVWEELMPGEDGALIADSVKDQYELLYGAWPENYDEVILFVSDRNEVSDLVLYALGYITAEDMSDTLKTLQNGETIEVEVRSWSYEELCETNFKLILPAEYFQHDALTGGFVDMTETDSGMDYLFNSSTVGTPLKVVGVARPGEDAGGNERGSIGYTSALTTYVIEVTAEMDIVKAQMEDETTDIFLNLPFATGEEEEPSDVEKEEAIRAYFEGRSNQEKADAYLDIMSQASNEYVESIVSQQMEGMTRESIEEMIVQQYASEMGVDAGTIMGYIQEMSDETLFAQVREAMAAGIREQYAGAVRAQMGAMTVDQMAGAFDMAMGSMEQNVVQPFEGWQYVYLYDNYMPATVSKATYEENLDRLGYVDLESPDTISLYVTSFEDKDKLAELIEAYNKSVPEDDEIEYTDLVALLMSSITTIINAVSYVLIAFVAISLVVSSIMIGIITYISVLERTKEIGVLRAIGASKKDVSRVFNAETLIVGFGAGVIGIGVTLLLLIPINLILHALTGISALSAQLPVAGGVILVFISMFLTFIAGLVPSGLAAKKNPVEALRTE